jgi:Phosphotransferase enzyme family
MINLSRSRAAPVSRIPDHVPMTIDSSVAMFDAKAEARASRAAAKAARLLGVSKASPVVLRRSRHISIHLPDLSSVARISWASAENVAAAARELRVTRYLLERDAPVVAPSEMMPSEPLIQDGMAVTLWPHVVHAKADDDNDEGLVAAAYALRRVQDALAEYPGELPFYADEIEQCARLLRDPTALPAMAAEDRMFLIRAYERLSACLSTLPVQPSPIHGDAHMGNVFFTPSGPLWTDFEAVSLGPRERDASGVPHLPAFQPIDPKVYAVMSSMRSLCVAVWCSAFAADSDKRAAAEYHLGRLREGQGLRSSQG